MLMLSRGRLICTWYLGTKQTAQVTCKLDMVDERENVTCE
jgi:hypothetical protein